MINIIKNNKIKVLIFGIVMLLAFLFTITMPKAYTIDREGNLVSQNLFNINEFEEGGTTGDAYQDWVTVQGPWYIVYTLNLQNNTDYYVSYNATGTTKIISIWNEDITTNIARYDDESSGTFNTGNNTIVKVLLYSGWGTYGTTTYRNIMINEGNTGLPYERYGIWYSTENLEIINPWIDNIESVTYETQNIMDLNAETAVYYVSPDNIAFNLLLHANGIGSSTDYQYARYIEINFKRPVNMSNYKYTISFNNNGPTGEQPTYVGFGVTNGPNYIYNFEYEAVDYQFQIPNNTYVDSIELKWYSTTDKPSWPEGMTLDDYYMGWSHGVQQGTREGYNNGYNDGYNTGLQSGENIGYNNGYAKGLEEGATSGNTLYGMIIRSCRHTN